MYLIEDLILLGQGLYHVIYNDIFGKQQFHFLNYVNILYFNEMGIHRDTIYPM